MAIAKQSMGVTVGYKPKVKQVERRKQTLLQRAALSLSANAREIREFVADEIVYATMDTARLLNYLRYEFGLAGVRRTVDVRRMTSDEGRSAIKRLETTDGRVVGLPADGI